MAARKCSCFTLIELLVVIAVISIMLALSVSSLMNAKRKTQQLVCNNNLRQLASATSQYEIDYKGFIPCMWDNVQGNMQEGGWTYYSSFPNEGATDFDPSKGTLYDYVKKKESFLCPRQDVKQGNDYAINALLGGDLLSLGFHAGMPTKLMKWPSQTFLFIEEASNGKKSTDDAYLLPPGNVSTERHNGTGNFAFCDGHVQNLPPATAAYPNPYGQCKYEPY